MEIKHTETLNAVHGVDGALSFFYFDIFFQ